MDRTPFYEIAIPYLPKNREAMIVDVGSGEGAFASHLNNNDPHINVTLLDANNQAVQSLKERGFNAIKYKAPDKLPFENGTVDLIHCSHLVEHLTNEELYSFLKEIDRVTCAGGILIISAPLLWEGFYGDLSHVRPYAPAVFVRYLCNQSGQHSAKSVSREFVVEKLVYRYADSDSGEWGATNIVLDFVIQVAGGVLKKLGIRKYIRNGFTLVLKRNAVDKEPDVRNTI